MPDRLLKHITGRGPEPSYQILNAAAKKVLDTWGLGSLMFALLANEGTVQEADDTHAVFSFPKGDKITVYRDCRWRGADGLHYGWFFLAAVLSPRLRAPCCRARVPEPPAS